MVCTPRRLPLVLPTVSPETFRLGLLDFALLFVLIPVYRSNTLWSWPAVLEPPTKLARHRFRA